ncbi:MAG: hypothetical protein Q9162_000788 [Coniocarpon cinnabarinum]
MLFAAAPLTPGAFVALGSQAYDDGRPGEDHMLDASREEIESQVPEFVSSSHRIRHAVYYVIDTYLWEPMCTGLRFLHLLVIFVPVIATVPLIWLGRRQNHRSNERSGTLWWYGFLVSSMERAGAAFIKLGQWAASRTDIFPSELCAVMSNLHSNAPAHSMRVTRKTIERAFDGRHFEDIFEEFQEKPLGVGAIAQVYCAKLKPDLAAISETDLEENRLTLRQRVRRNVDALAKSTPQRVPSSYVAIKVLHPRVERIVRRDLRIMSFVANLINVIPTMEWLSFPDEVFQFGQMMKLQLDLRIEAANLTLFRRKFKDRTTASFPFPYADYITKEVLVEEFAHGIPLADFLESGGGVFQKDIAHEGLDAFLRMVLIDNFIHADLHPGNIMVRFYKPAQIEVPASMDVLSRTRKNDEGNTIIMKNNVEPEDTLQDVTEEVLEELRPHRHNKQAWEAQLEHIDREGYRPQLIFIDTGLVTELSDINRRNFLDLFKAVAEFDGYRAGHLMVERCRQPDAVIDEEVFALRMQHLVLGVKSRTFAMGSIKIGDVLSEVLDMVRAHHVRLEGDFVNVLLSILLLEGIGRNLDPDMDIFARQVNNLTELDIEFLTLSRSLPILRQLGTQGGTSMLQSGDFSMIKVWAGLEARKFITASVEEVNRCVQYDQLSPNI